MGVNQAIEKRGASASSRVAEEKERRERQNNPRIPAGDISKTLSEIHTALIRTVGAKDAVAAAKVEGQERTTKYLKSQFLLDIERLGNRKMAASASDKEKARRLGEPAVIQDREVADAMVSAMSAMVRFHAVSDAISQMEGERQRRVVEDKTKSVHDELIRTMNKRFAVKQMDDELKRRMSKPEKKPTEIKEIIADVQIEVVRLFSQKFAALEASIEKERRVAVYNFHQVKEELERKMNQRNVDLAMNLELSKQCASWFQAREEDVAATKLDVQSDLVRRVVENARGDVFAELNRVFNRKSVIRMMAEEQKRRCERPYVIAKDVDAVLSEAHSKIISKVGVKTVTALAEEERTERVAVDQLSAVLESLCSTVNRKINSKKARAAVMERQQIYENRDMSFAKVHRAVVESISG